MRTIWVFAAIHEGPGKDLLRFSIGLQKYVLEQSWVEISRTIPGISSHHPTLKPLAGARSLLASHSLEYLKPSKYSFLSDFHQRSTLKVHQVLVLRQADK
tara:strand:+ start:1179 stop:1478 length:300 start_codon:yes stop_codon:yes gene_type:complete